MVYTHKKTGWTRESVPGSYGGKDRIVPTDGSGDRIVAMMQPGSWGNYPTDDKAKINECRIVLLEGAPLPDWAMRWLNKVNEKRYHQGREALAAAIDDADQHQWNQWADSY